MESPPYRPALDCHRNEFAPEDVQAAAPARPNQDNDDIVCDVHDFCGVALSGLARSSRCCRCRKLAGSYFDHECPQCSGTVCVACLDDVRLVIHSFRCPKCGEAKANQESLKREMWMFKAFRETQRVISAIGQTVSVLGKQGCPAGDAGSTQVCSLRKPPSSAPSVNDAHEANFNAPGQPDHGTRVLNGYQSHEQLANYASSWGNGGVNLACEQPDVPERGTRLPANYAAGFAGALAGYAPPSAGRTNDVRPNPFGTSDVQPNPFSTADFKLEEQVEDVPERGTRLPPNWHELAGQFRGYSPPAVSSRQGQQHGNVAQPRGAPQQQGYGQDFRAASQRGDVDPDTGCVRPSTIPPRQ